MAPGKIDNERWPAGCSFRVLGRARFCSCTPHSKRLCLCILNIVEYGFGNTRGQGPRMSIRPTGSSVFVFVRDVTHVQTCEKKCFVFRIFGSYLKHVQTCDDVRVQSATQSTASVHTSNMSKSVMTFVFKVLRNPGSLVAYALQPCKTMYILHITTKYLWELRNSERARPRTRNVAI